MIQRRQVQILIIFSMLKVDQAIHLLGLKNWYWSWLLLGAFVTSVLMVCYPPNQYQCVQTYFHLQHICVQPVFHLVVKCDKIACKKYGVERLTETHWIIY